MLLMHLFSLNNFSSSPQPAQKIVKMTHYTQCKFAYVMNNTLASVRKTQCLILKVSRLIIKILSTLQSQRVKYLKLHVQSASPLIAYNLSLLRISNKCCLKITKVSSLINCHHLSHEDPCKYVIYSTDERYTYSGHKICLLIHRDLIIF
jgi:hypothetical protein